MTRNFLTKTVPAKTVSTKTIPENFNEKKVILKIENLYILFTFLIFITSLLIIFNVYCCLIKHLLWHQSKNKLKMSNKLKEIDMKNRTYCFFNDLINIKNLDQNKIKTDEKPYKNIFIHDIGYLTLTTLNTWHSKTLAKRQVIMYIRYRLLSIISICALKKAMK